MRILALDVGKRRIGIAVSDPLGITARPHSTIQRNQESASKIAAIAQDLAVEQIVIGLPLHLDGSEGEQAEDVRRFAAKLAPLIGPTTVAFRDERLTRVEAGLRLSDRRKNRRMDRSRIDAMAAAVILEDCLNDR